MATATAIGWPFVGRHGEVERVSDALDGGLLDAVVLTGSSGVGKTRLAQECLAEAESRGHRVAHVAATASASAVPLSALAPLLPVQMDLTDPHALFEAVRRWLHEQASGRRFVLAVDDVDLLDTVSVALLQFLLADGSLFVIATQRTDTRLPDVLESRWRSGRALRVRLDSLEKQSVETLLHFALGGPVSTAASEALWQASRGNVLYLRELVGCGQRDGTLVCADGVWRLTGPLTDSAGVVELVSRRLHGLDPQQRAVLELLALCEPLAVDDLLRHTPVDVLAELEAQGLIQVRLDGRRQDVTLTHPLHAEALQHAMPRLRARSLLLAQVERVEGYGARRRGDPLMLASWRLDATGTADPTLLVRAASLARFAHDLPRTERLAEAALRHGPDGLASLLLGEALHEQARYAEAEQVLAEATGGGAGPEAFRLVLARSLNLHHGLGDTRAARECLAGADGEAGDPARVAVDALLTGVTDTGAALELLGDAEPGTDPGRVLWLRSRATVLADAGRLADAAVAAERGFARHRQLDYRMVVSHPATQLVVLTEALREQGRLAEAEETAREGFRLAVADGIHSLIGAFPAQLGLVALTRGRVGTAERYFREALAHLRGGGRPPALVSGVTGLVVALAWRGALAADDPLLTLPDGELIAARGRGWALCAVGRQREAGQELRAAGGLAVGQGRLTLAVELLHDALRLGDPAAARELVGVTGVQGDLAAARLAHADAVLRRDPDALAAAARTFEQLGVDLVAAEVLVAAAELYRATGTPRSATACANQAATLVQRCEGARTPGLVTPVGHSPLTAREREVALLVAEGYSSKRIAAELFISVRTVDNHLQSIYTKCGVKNRSELAAVMGTAGAVPVREDERT
ncbi:helix-turn-helix transcriptional regulator [Micromonospora echinofusca]|uniref:AAA family ATPase n=1 Tax=Micromonospora echinofusca TaxID=47858 RepID=A0ABS3VUU0_MICEH|nr:LuxR family transcriptional regulator [Micromonospora echinofusca]MBO4208260.1 AAA family ATPase [Micromonospora echinofusca]